MTRTAPAHHDNRLSARIVRRTALHYKEGVDDDADRPPHVRAASSLATFEEHLAIIQDDTSYLALVDADSREVYSVALPASDDGDRVFDADRGNRHKKLDLEACTVVPDSDGERLIAFGSGSSENREWVLGVRYRGGKPEVDLQDASALYTYLRGVADFAGSGLNVEGAVFVGKSTLRLFQRGNSQASDTAGPVDATADFHWPELDAWLRDPEHVALPELRNIVQYELGEMEGIRLTFSDAELRADGAVLFSASAEARDDSDHIAGSVLGVIDADGAARWSLLHDEDGALFRGKIEGLALSRNDDNHLYFVIDDDNADEPSVMFEARLEGPW